MPNPFPPPNDVSAECAPVVEQDPEIAERRRQSRAAWIGRLILVWGVIVAGRLTYVQVARHSFYKAKAEAQHFKVLRQSPVRGDITDVNDQGLALSERTYTFAVNPQNTFDAEFLLFDVAGPILGLNEQEIHEHLERIQHLRELFQQVKKKKELKQELTKEERDTAYFLHIVKRHIPDEMAPRLKALGVSGVKIIDDARRHYPNGGLAAHVVGALGQVSKLKQSGLIGVAGIEQEFESRLRGEQALVRVHVDSHGEPYESLVLQGAPGANLRLTIHHVIQQEAEEALKKAIEEHRGKRGWVVVMDPENGEILALAAYPSFDPADLEVNKAQVHARSDTPWSTAIEPGSVVKAITIAAALNEGIVTPDDVFYCENGIWSPFGGKPINDHHRYGALSVADTLIKSSNICTAKIAQRLGANKLEKYLRLFGAWRPTGIELPAEGSGFGDTRIPEHAWRGDRYLRASYGYVLMMTPIQLVSAMSAIANGGKLVKPTLVRDLQLYDRVQQRMVSQRPVQPEPLPVIKPEVAAIMRQLLARVVMEGTGKAAQIEGYTAGGKTGTAELLGGAKYEKKGHNAASFIGFAPATKPRIAMIATIYDTPAMGGVAAAPLFSKVGAAALRILRVPRDREEKLAAAAPAKEPGQGEPAKIPDAPQPVPIDPRLLLAPRVPDFRSRNMGAVMKLASAAGVPVQVAGRGIARHQEPPPGAALAPGQKVIVRFERN